jgi:hypothetical protein
LEGMNLEQEESKKKRRSTAHTYEQKADYNNELKSFR